MENWPRGREKREIETVLIKFTGRVPVGKKAKKSRKGGVITREAKYLLGEETAVEFVETLLSLSFGCVTRYFVCNFCKILFSFFLYITFLVYTAGLYRVFVI